MGDFPSRRTLLALSALTVLGACSQIMLHTRFVVDDTARASYRDALDDFLRHYGYRASEWRPSYGYWEFDGVYEGLRTRFWIAKLDPSRFEAWFTYKDDLFGAFASGAKLLEIVKDFERRILATGAHIEDGYS